MEDEELFKTGNLKFVSQHEGIVGSLYFLAANVKGLVFRGRIRMVHENGPEISNRQRPESSWLLVNSIGYDNHKNHRKKDEKNIYGDLVKNFESTINNAKNQDIHEIYTNGRHRSRGKLKIFGEGRIHTGINQEQLCKLIAEIKKFTDDKGKCKKSEIDAANKNIICLINNPENGFPEWIKQENGKYGC